MAMEATKAEPMTDSGYGYVQQFKADNDE